ncbi:hypothetical protein [Actinokineospora iranica]|uniref:X-X-X-Leu-X-X-Gly heptad repeat-containing protein n=1 Tax=Actinokineospora iranica TaxID=1271860 RepID=A0A1G6XVK0_9PSEU|nr:hypothetical protein [Actinokineospora iranica]SDD82254.1 hypothetical protein SAMN05216174_11925 [Actinokineospora iranica]
MTAAATSLVLVAAACTSAPEPAPAAKTAWADRLCAAVADANAALATAPPPIDTGDPAAVKNTLSAYLGTLTEGLGRAVEAVRGLGQSPIDGGDRVSRTAGDAYEGLRRPLTEAKTVLDGAQDADTVARVVSEIAPRLEAVAAADPLAVDGDSDFTHWAEQAPRCAEVPALRR